ncbi:LLM class flavin-dependent oxidoreductase [Virgibacillus kekensis]|uniref:LLM class flavin-dependent oxidoreductase n=1 Tax=Virgibacillus kekensis TaxID=202261 RepID=A0ABV9DIP0_9BACI
MRLSILDQAPISGENTAREALEATIELAKTADKLGYARYWVAEHHDLSGLACPAPDVILGIIGSQTERIMIGAGAVLLPHYKPFNIAERYNLLATLYPGRVDLGIGRAPGGSAEATMALSGNFLQNVKEMPESLDALLKFLHNEYPADDMFAKIKPTPVPEAAPEAWLLGTSKKSAVLAAEKGLPYTFGHFMSGSDGPGIVAEYREELARHHPGKTPRVIVTVSVISAETSEEAHELALSNQLWSVQRAKGEGDGRIPSVAEAKRYSFTDEEREQADRTMDKLIVGDPREVRQQLEHLQEQYQADELMIVTITHDYEARKRSYKLLADEVLVD